MITRLGSPIRFPSSMLAWAVAVVSMVGPGASLDAALQVLSDQQIESSIEKLGISNNRSLSESSGLAISQTIDAFWTMNDSGTGSKLFLIHKRGKLLAEYSVESRNIDWEAMSRFTIGDQSWLVIGDVGDNLRRRKSYQLYFFKEPRSLKKKKATKSELSIDPIEIEIHFSADGTSSGDFKDGLSKKSETKPVNCEAMAVDPLTNEIWFVEKVEITNRQKTAPGIYVLPLPDDVKDATLPNDGQSAKDKTKKHVAKRIASFPIRNVTGMAFSPDGNRLAIRNYLNAHLYRRDENASWKDTIETTKPVAVVLPLQRQGEAVCFSPDSKSLILTSEVDQQPIWRVGLDDYLDMPVRQRTQSK